jgi:apolipoprotein N-acyltransferase
MTTASLVDSPAERVRAPLMRAGAWLGALTGWRRDVLAFVMGAISALAFAPFGIFPALLLGYAIVILLIDGAAQTAKPVRSAARIGWAFGFGQFLAGLYWVGYAFTVDAANHAWQIPFVALLLPGYLALFPALACAIAARFWASDSGRIFLFAALMAVCEWLRGHLLTGFPWNLAAYGWGAAPAVMQSAAFVGPWGLTLLTVLLGASLAEFASRRSSAWRLPAALIGAFALLWIGGESRLALVHPDDVPGVRLRLVQPDVPQAEKFVPKFMARNWARLVDLSTAPAARPPTHIIWPEAAPPFPITRVPEALDKIATLTPGDRVLMTGTVRVLATPDSRFRYFNSLDIFSHGGQLIGVYDKFHLVPFGEYLPLPGLLHALGLNKLVAMPDGFGEGPGPRTYAVPGAPPVGPLICYEVIFPDEIVARDRPGWIVNVSDDAWFGPSTGPYQHLLMARMRAIEQGLPIARDTNTGISAVIDPLGRIVRILPLGRTGFLDSNLPRALPTTLYARLGDTGFVLLLVACCLWRFRSFRRSDARERPP